MKEELLNNLRLQKEFVLCEKDPIYFMSNYANCIHPTHGSMPFSPHPYQEDYIDALVEDENHIFVSAARRVGSSLSTSMYLLWRGFFNKFETIALTSNRQDQSCSNLQTIRHAYLCMPPWMRDANPMVVNNQTYIEFANGSRFIVKPASTDAYRGLNLSVVFIDNFTIIRSDRELEEMIHGFQRMDVKTIAVAHDGGSSLFNNIYSAAAHGGNPFKAYRLTSIDYGIGIL